MEVGLAIPAFLAGVLAALNPCGFALLPAYAAVILSPPGENLSVTETGNVHPNRRGVALAAASMSAGAVGVVATAGTTLSLLASLGSRLIPWVSGGIGVAFVVLGAGSLLGVTRFPHFSFDPRPSRRGRSVPAVYGAAYAVASLGCTLPVFLSVVAFAAHTRGLLIGVVLYFWHTLWDWGWFWPCWWDRLRWDANF